MKKTILLENRKELFPPLNSCQATSLSLGNREQLILRKKVVVNKEKKLFFVPQELSQDEFEKEILEKSL